MSESEIEADRSPQAGLKLRRERVTPAMIKQFQNGEIVATAEESKMHRLRVGDQVSWNDTSEFPPVQYEGEVTGFDNEEKTYLQVSLKKVGDDGETSGKASEKVLTEDEVTRIG